MGNGNNVSENKEMEMICMESLNLGWLRQARRKKKAQCKTLWDFGFRTYDARLKSMIFRNRYSSSAMP